MLYILTGTPGSGKTLYMVSEMNRVFKDRRIFYVPSNPVTGETGITLSEQGERELGWHKLDDATKWYELPQGSVVLIDEAWQFFKGIYGKDDNKPQHYKEIATHRHKGLDIVLATQRPVDLDTFVRGRVYEHRHLEPAKFGAGYSTLYKLDNKCLDIDGNNRIVDKRGAIQETYTYKKSNYDLYTSAVLHTKKPRLNKKMMAVAGFLIATPLLIIFLLTTLKNNQFQGNEVIGEQELNQVPNILPLPQSIAGESDKLTYDDLETWLSLYTPRITTLPSSAPIYDSLVSQVRDFPTASNCVYSEERDFCQCYTQQATKIYTEKKYCMDIVKNGYFDPYKQKVNTRVRVNRG